MKAYSIALNEADDSVEINLYGEIVSNRPVDFWTGEKISGLYIVLDEFLKDIEEIKGKAEVTFHINSPGGDVFAGTSIYNKMKQFAGTVTTVVDGLAASAASVIAQGATPGHRKVCNGSLMMIHGASTMLFGYYNANEVKGVLKRVNAVDKSLAEIYSGCTGREEEKIKTMMSQTTWMTSQEIVDNGFADEVINTDTQVSMCLNNDKSLLTVNGIQMAAKGLHNLPDYIPVQNMVAAGENPDVITTKNTNTGGMKKSMTAEELKANHPELYAQIRNDAVEEAKAGQQENAEKLLEAERARMKEIDDIAGKIADKQLVTEAKYGEKKMSAGELALAALKKQADIGADYLQGMLSDIQDSRSDEVTPTPNQGNLSAGEQRAKDIADGAALIAGVTLGK